MKKGIFFLINVKILGAFDAFFQVSHIFILKIIIMLDDFPFSFSKQP